MNSMDNQPVPQAANKCNGMHDRTRLKQNLGLVLTAIMFAFSPLAHANKTSLETNPKTYSPDVETIVLSPRSQPGDVIYSKQIGISYQLTNDRGVQDWSNGEPNYLHSFYGAHNFSCGGNLSGVSGVKWRMKFAGSNRVVSCGTDGVPVAINYCDDSSCIAEGELVIELYRSQGKLTKEAAIKFPGIRFSGPMRWLGDSGQGFRLQAVHNDLKLTTQAEAGNQNLAFTSLK